MKLVLILVALLAGCGNAPSRRDQITTYLNDHIMIRNDTVIFLAPVVILYEGDTAGNVLTIIRDDFPSTGVCLNIQSIQKDRHLGLWYNHTVTEDSL